MIGKSIRIAQVRQAFDRIPAYTLRDMYGVTAHACGKCFQKLGDDPLNGRPGQMTPGVPPGSRCVFCGKPAVAAD